VRLSALVAWAGLIPIMIANGVARESLYGPKVGDLPGHQISTAIGVLLLFGYVWLVFPWLRLTSPADGWRVGGLWVLLTVCFEFGFGRLVAGHSWSRLLQDYNLLAGRVWILFLAATALIPWLIFRVRATT